MTELQAKAIKRIRQAGVNADLSALIAWIECVKPTTILESTLQEIREAAGAF